MQTEMTKAQENLSYQNDPTFGWVPQMTTLTLHQASELHEPINQDRLWSLSRGARGTNGLPANDVRWRESLQDSSDYESTEVTMSDKSSGTLDVLELRIWIQIL